MKDCDKPGKDELFHISVTIATFVNMHTHKASFAFLHSTSVQKCVRVLIFLFLMFSFTIKTENLFSAAQKTVDQCFFLPNLTTIKVVYLSQHNGWAEMGPCRPHFLVFKLPPGTVFLIYRTKEVCQCLVVAKHRKEHCSTLLVSEGKSGTNEATEWRNQGEGKKLG